ncbi:MAG: alkaline phosphatase D family protein [Sandaracinaceae bacterium]|nr:alkaline phosphatase D family protein [Sandaracinaceae bacterium]
MSKRPSPPAFTRRAFLHTAALATSASVLPGCDGDPPPMDAGLDAGSDAGPPIEEDAGILERLPPRERTYETFEHGIASGDPLTDAVILWTRVTPGTPTAPVPERVEVEWELGAERAMSTIVASGAATTDASRDFTVKLDVTGLSPGTTYYYRFRALGATSPLGRTRTAPEGAVDRLRFGFCSCASLAHGFYHAYGKLAQRADLDAILHLGDYIYEYGNAGYGGRREHLPAHEILSLADYRERYAQYRREPELREVHRQHPFIAIWDDHETANNSWSGGAENHTEGAEGRWVDRLAAASQAYREWMPIRELDAGERLRLWRKLGYGALCDVIALDTRIWGREEETENLVDPPVNDPDRQLLGADQEAWLFEQLRTSTARWKLIAQQVMMGAVSGFPNPDQWDGYPAARRRVLETIRDEGVSDVIVLTGDIHSSWAFDLPLDPTDEAAYDPASGRGSLAVELVTPAITSPGFPPVIARAGASFVRNNRSLFFAELTRRGFVILDLTEARAQADWFFVGDVALEDDDAEEHAASWATAAGASHLVEALAPVPPRPDAPPLA